MAETPPIRPATIEGVEEVDVDRASCEGVSVAVEDVGEEEV